MQQPIQAVSEGKKNRFLKSFFQYLKQLLSNKHYFIHIGGLELNIVSIFVP